MAIGTHQHSVLRPGEEGYEAARRVWNAMVDKHPALIARCAGPADVVAAVRFAREQDLLVAIRGGATTSLGWRSVTTAW